MILKLLFLLFTILLSTINACDLEDFIDWNDIFSTTITKAVGDDEKYNYIVSPVSIKVMLALTSEGSKGETFDQVTSIVGIPKNTTNRHDEYKNLISSLNVNSSDLKLFTANKIYVQENSQLKQEFQDVSKEVYMSGIQNINFNNSANAANVINQWVEEHTNNQIRVFISPDKLNALTSVVMVNSLYFLGEWMYPFNPKETKEEDFTTLSGNIVRVPFMRNVGFYNYMEDKFARVVEIPYKEKNYDRLSMIVMLPKRESDLEFMNTIFDVQRKLSGTLMEVIIPKFSIEYSIELTTILQKLGITDLFNEKNADLSGMAGEKGELVVTNVLQKSFINVTEYGTEAAAATAVIVGFRSVVPSVTFHASKTFTYYIQFNDVILFSGRVADPS